jgi:DNA-binding LacI/PurR family transcriptional regulator
LGRRQARSQDVAKLAGVSRTTVSFVLNNVPGVKITEETRQRVLEAARELDYYPTAAARSLASGKTQRVGLILGEGQERLAADAFLPSFLQGVTASVHRRGYLLVLQLAEDVPSHEAYVRLIREQQVDGLILSGPRSGDPLLSQLAEERFPLILHGRLESYRFPSVDVDNKAGAYQAVTHLIGLGHRRIGFISNAPLSYSGAQDRFAGYRQALAEHDIPLDGSLVHTAAFLPKSGRVAMQSLLKVSERPTAVFAASDVVAFGAMDAIHAAGLRIPDEVAVVGFDDIFLAAHAYPPLTTVRVPAYGLGWTSAEILITLIEGEEDAPSVTLETELVIRESCGAERTAGS